MQASADRSDGQRHRRGVRRARRAEAEQSLIFSRSHSNGSSAEQEVSLEARHAPLARRAFQSTAGARADNRRSAPAPPHQPERLLPRQEGRQDQRRIGSGTSTVGAPRGRHDVPQRDGKRMEVKVAIDCMGGDHGAHVTVPAALSVVRGDQAASVILVGRRDVVERELMRHNAVTNARVSIRHASEVVEMNEAPAAAMRAKKDSSMRIAVNLVETGEAAACVSAGNTGALMAISRFVLGMLPGIDRPAIATILPTLKGHTYILDLGANVDCTPEHLLQFGLMCSELVRSVEGKPRPTVGLLNIGVEDIKGNDQVKQAADLLRDSGLNFVGNVEGDDIYKGN